MSHDRNGLYEIILKNKIANIVFKGLIVLLVFILVAAFALSVTCSNIFEEDLYVNSKSNSADKNYKYNFLVVTYHPPEDFLRKYRESVHNYGEKNGVLIDFVKAENIDQAVNSINVAVAAKVDGIIAQGIYDVKYISAINKAINEEIPVEFFYTDARGANRSYFVGFNPYDLGKNAAKVTVDSLQDSSGEVALLVQSFSEDEKDITSSLHIEGFKSVIDKYDNIKIVEIIRTSDDLFSAEDITYDILRRHPYVDAIVCNREKDTFGAAQVIIDLNRVGDIHLIGVGASEEILRYIDLKVIDASFDMKPEEMGRKCIEAMIGIHGASDFIEIQLDKVTFENVSEFRR